MQIDAVDRYLESVGARRLARGEWGLTVPDPGRPGDGEASGDGAHPLDIGLRAADGLLRIQAFAVPAADAPPSEDVLHWNRATRIVRFSRTRDGDVWVQADLPLASAGDEIDRVLGLVVEAARSARAAAYAEPAAEGGWLSGS
jgi:hypothetical protein